MTDLTIEEIKTGKVKIRAGYETRVLATDLGGDLPVCIAFKGNNGWKVIRLNEKGKPSHREDRDSEYDLVRIPQPQYFNIYRHPNGSGCTGYMCNSIHEAKEQAVKCAHNKTKLDDTYKYLDGEITKVEPEGDE